MPLRQSLFWHCHLQCLSARTFSTTAPNLAKSFKHNLAKSSKQKLADIPPPYPHGPARWYKQSNFGLYGGSRIRFGNNVSPDTETKTRRKWRPNIQHKRLWSAALCRYVQVKVSTRVLRTVDKCGGLDEYLVGEKSARVKELGVKGWELRWRVMNSAWWRKRAMEQRKALGLVTLEKELGPLEEEGEEEFVGRDGRVVSESALEDQVKQFDAEADAEEIVLEEGEERMLKDENVLEGGFMAEHPPPLPSGSTARL